jgi:transcriptional regulator with GAF, ATPase, and Fis domain
MGVREPEPEPGATPAPGAVRLEDDVDHESAADIRSLPSSEFSGDPSHHVDVSQVLGQMARDLDEQGTLDDTMRALVSAAVRTIPGAVSGGICEVRSRGRQVTARYSTDQLVTDLDSVQEELAEGPCLDEAYRHRTVRVNDFETEARWPSFAARALARDVRSMLSIQLYVRGEDLGTLNLYAHEAEAFDDESEDVGLLFATHAAIAMAGAQREHQLQVAVSSRDVIGQAKGILMERYKITADQAFAVLAKASSQTNIKLRKVAETLTESGDVTRS